MSIAEDYKKEALIRESAKQLEDANCAYIRNPMPEICGPPLVGPKAYHQPPATLSQHHKAEEKKKKEKKEVEKLLEREDTISNATKNFSDLGPLDQVDLIYKLLTILGRTGATAAETVAETVAEKAETAAKSTATVAQLTALFALKSEIKENLDTIANAIDKVFREAGDYELDSFELSISGGETLSGIVIELSGQGGLNLVYKKKAS